jgi:hypothetical protein
VLAHFLWECGLFQENSLALHGFDGILFEFRVGLVLQESGDLLVVILSTQHHGGITFVSRKYGERVVGF